MIDSNGIYVDIMIMSGVDDGMLLSYSLDNGDGKKDGSAWILSIGRRDDNDIALRKDTYASRYHARLHLRDGSWWLEDYNSKNGTFIEDDDDDARISGTIALSPNQLFRVGRTWLRIHEGI